MQLELGSLNRTSDFNDLGRRNIGVLRVDSPWTASARFGLMEPPASALISMPMPERELQRRRSGLAHANR